MFFLDINEIKWLLLISYFFSWEKHPSMLILSVSFRVSEEFETFETVVSSLLRKLNNVSNYSLIFQDIKVCNQTQNEIKLFSIPNYLGYSIPVNLLALYCITTIVSYEHFNFSDVILGETSEVNSPEHIRKLTSE